MLLINLLLYFIQTRCCRLTNFNQPTSLQNVLTHYMTKKVINLFGELYWPRKSLATSLLQQMLAPDLPECRQSKAFTQNWLE